MKYWKKYLKMMLTGILPVLYILIKESFVDFPLDSETFVVFAVWLITAILNAKIEKVTILSEFRLVSK